MFTFFNVRTFIFFMFIFTYFCIILQFITRILWFNNRTYKPIGYFLDHQFNNKNAAVFLNFENMLLISINLLSFFKCLAKKILFAIIVFFEKISKIFLIVTQLILHIVVFILYTFITYLVKICIPLLTLLFLLYFNNIFYYKFKFLSYGGDKLLD